MPRIDEMPEYRASLPRTAHDLSHKLGMTATVAHLMPVFHDFVNPGETVELGFDYNLRTQPLASAAMVDIKSHTEYFFVPMQLLFEPFGSWYYGIDDLYSSQFTTPVQQLPVLNFGWALGLIKGLDSEDDYNTLNIQGNERLQYQTVRLLDLLGFNPYGVARDGDNWNPNVFPYQLLAYHCIYELYYRLDNRERYNQEWFNWDKFYNTSVINADTIGDFYTDVMEKFIKPLFSIHSRPYDSDYFTDIKVSPIVDVLNLNNKQSLESAKQWLTRSMVNVTQGSRDILTSGSIGSQDYSPFGSGQSFNNPSSNIQTQFGFRANTYNFDTVLNGLDIGTANIRAMFASEKLWSVTGRARKHYDDQTLAHLGFKVPHDVKHDITCFGHDTNVIHIGEVISTASTDDASLGEIAGKGYASQHGRRHKFTAPCHGVVMCIQSFVPDLTYSHTFGKYNVMAERADLYTPEYDHLGMQPLFGYEVSQSAAYSSYRNNIIGWQYRYEQWKRRYNRLSLAFSAHSEYEGYKDGSLDSWMLDFRPYHYADSAYATSESVPNAETYYRFLHRPFELNQLMLVNYVTSLADTSEGSDNPYGVITMDNISQIYDGDPFVIDGFMSAKKISTMSDYSLPRLDA